jgi:predicted ATPase
MPSTVRLRQISVQNFKGIEALEIEFPEPRFEGDPDITVLGSENGLGKTSVLEACSLAFLAAALGREVLDFKMFQDFFPLDLFDLLIKAGSEEAEIAAVFTLGGREYRVQLRLQGGKNAISFKGDTNRIRQLFGSEEASLLSRREVATRFFFSLAGLHSEPLLLRHFLYFHSYRKVQEGSPELGMMVESERFTRARFRTRNESPASTVKLAMLRAMLSRAGLFENMEDLDAQDSLTILNRLMREYARGTLAKLRPSAESTIDFRIQPLDAGDPFSFDGLSSGQKEIISTLFLIWNHTHAAPGVVIIDEPELHLNAEWHRSFVRNMHDLVPSNQYILATHSEDVFSSVEDDRRLMLLPVGADRL